MKTLISKFTLQLKESLYDIEKVSLAPAREEISNVVVCGMGGSGIGGKIVADIVYNECAVPIHIVNDYFLPEFTNENSLVIISSYSGDTEEVLLAYIQAQQKKSRIICITSGGKLAGLARENHNDLLLLPDGIPPRSALGYSVIRKLFILHSYSLISAKYTEQCESAIRLIDLEEENIREDARSTAEFLKDKITVIYSLRSMESVALRFRQQLNENAKSLAWHHTFPELNHNEIQGWRKRDHQPALVIFRNENDYIRSSRRMDLTRDMISDFTSCTKEVHSKGNSLLEQILYLTHWSDWTSYHIAELKGQDTLDTGNIRTIKSELEKI